ncbi:MAG: trimethylamine methyltransferase family protein [Actinobacteria bacterium]|nr:trimethylamine methyltransferase family protein [Actinomycetota bacterium]MCI0545402.1 trimethylamine methyltransferase family protein [Actinomycetota bacterium]
MAARPHLHVLDDQLIDSVLTEAKRVLAETGMEIRGPLLRERLLAHGLPQREGRILFPPEVVDWAVGQAPESFHLHDREGRPVADIGGDRVHFVPGSSGLKIADHRTGETRLASTADFVEYVRLADGLGHIAYLATAFSTNDDGLTSQSELPLIPPAPEPVTTPATTERRRRRSR